MVGIRFLVAVMLLGGCRADEAATCVANQGVCASDQDCCEGICGEGDGLCHVIATCSEVDQACVPGGTDCCEALNCNETTLACEELQPLPAATMSFFVTSQGNAEAGGNLGGLDAADLACQTLIEAALVPDEVKNQTWRAYLSTTPIYTNGIPAGNPVHARDRIGAGPWFNFDGVMIAASVADLHTNGILQVLIFDENGAVVPATEHAILTGSKADGTAEDETENDFLQFGFENASCGNWTSNNSFRNTLAGTTDGTSWNTGERVFCNLGPTANSTGRFYCFAQ